MLVYAAQICEEMKEALDALEIPYILIDCYCPLAGANAVTVNNRQGIFTASNICMIKGTEGSGISVPEAALLPGGTQEKLPLRDGGGRIDEDPRFCVEEAGTGQDAQEYLEELWKDTALVPSAMVLENDLMAIAVYRALKGRGLRIPEDVSVVGFDGRSICSMLEPALTTLRVPRREMGRLLVMLLLQKIELQGRTAEQVTVRLEIDAELVEMDSVKECREGLININNL